MHISLYCDAVVETSPVIMPLMGLNLADTASSLLPSRRNRGGKSVKIVGCCFFAGSIREVRELGTKKVSTL